MRAMTLSVSVAGTKRGRLKDKQVHGSIGVLESLDNFMPIGEAHRKTWDDEGRAVDERKCLRPGGPGTAIGVIGSTDLG
jgi:hypothetical protein